MTKNAQQALKYLLEEYPNNVRFCLICNYISKIDEGLQNEFLKLRFDQLPQKEVVTFLEKLSKEENINLNQEILHSIQRLFKSDLRSMVNYIQTNQDMLENNYHIINDGTWDEMFNIVSNYKTISKQEMVSHVHLLSVQYNIDTKNIIVNFLNYIIRNKKNLCSTDFLLFTENIIHSRITNERGLLYLFNKLIEFIEDENSSS